MNKTPAALRWGRAAGALAAALIVSGTVVGIPPSEPKAVEDFEPWPSPATDAPEATQAPVAVSVPTPAPTEAPRPSPRPEVTTRPKVAQPVPKPQVQVKPKPTRKPVIVTVDGRITGDASWYCNANRARGPLSICMAAHPDTRGFDAYAAAGPRLRRALGPNWRNRCVWVNGIPVVLADWCRCPDGRVIDLYADVAEKLGLLRRGHGVVVVAW